MAFLYHCILRNLTIHLIRITSINQLTNYLTQCNQSELKDIYPFLNIPKIEFAPYLLWSKEKYTRNCIIKTDNYELIVMCWEKGQGSAIHSHDNQECWVYNIDGKFSEDRFEIDKNGNMKKFRDIVLYGREHSYMTDNMGYHDLNNINDGRSISLHLYAKPLKKCKVYNKAKNGFEFMDLNYDSIDGKTTLHYQK